LLNSIFTFLVSPLAFLIPAYSLLSAVFALFINDCCKDYNTMRFNKDTAKKVGATGGKKNGYKKLRGGPEYYSRIAEIRWDKERNAKKSINLDLINTYEKDKTPEIDTGKQLALLSLLGINPRLPRKRIIALVHKKTAKLFPPESATGTRDQLQEPEQIRLL